MSIVTGIACVVLCFVFIEAISGVFTRKLRTRGLPYEIQYFPLFFLLFFTLQNLQEVVKPQPILTLLLKLGLFYSFIGGCFLLFLAFLRHLHYQTYIFIINWLKRE
ncbi:hypothetical protein ACFDTO_36395 [Microbacteriaceae bacterium 4G12]